MTSKKLSRPLTPQLRAFVLRISPDLGGTVALPTGSFPVAFTTSGIPPRNPDWNLFLGITASHPTPSEHLIGLAYVDLKADQTDEDLYRADLVAGDLKYFPRGSYERVNPAYRGTHHGPKPYLRTAPDPIE